MNSTKIIGDYDAATSIDGSTNYLLLQPGDSSTAYKKINRNTLLGVTGQPMDVSSTQSVTNKTLDNSNIITVRDDRLTLQDNADTTKQAKFQLSGITTGTTRTYTLPDASSTLVDLGTAQTLTNKTLTSPAISGGSLDNSTVTVDAVSGHTTANSGTIYGIPIVAGAFTSLPGNNIVTNANIASGQLYTSKVTNLYKFSAYRSGAQSLTLGTTQKIQFETKEYDTSSNFDTTNFRFVAPIAGFYKFSAAIGVLASTNYIASVHLYKNGSLFKVLAQSTTNSSNLTLGNSATLSLNPTDYVEIFVLNTAAANVTVNVGSANTWFMGELVSAL